MILLNQSSVHMHFYKSQRLVRYGLDDPSRRLFEPNNDPKNDPIPLTILLAMLLTVSTALLKYIDQVFLTHSYRTLPHSSIFIRILLLPDPLLRVIGRYKYSSIWISTVTLSAHPRSLWSKSSRTSAKALEMYLFLLTLGGILLIAV